MLDNQDFFCLIAGHQPDPVCRFGREGDGGQREAGRGDGGDGQDDGTDEQGHGSAEVGRHHEGVRDGQRKDVDDRRDKSVPFRVFISYKIRVGLPSMGQHRVVA